MCGLPVYSYSIVTVCCPVLCSPGNLSKGVSCSAFIFVVNMILKETLEIFLSMYPYNRYINHISVLMCGLLAFQAYVLLFRRFNALAGWSHAISLVTE
jgi:hypothetical protein